MVLAKRPPMGWNSWNTFGTDISESLICRMADILASEGYLEAGYDTLVVDDGWQSAARTADGHLSADPVKFPRGMKAVADYVHGRGLKFGIYSAAGVETCAGYPGSFGHEFTDARDFAAWGVDYLKYDLCHFPGSGNMQSAYLTMSMALKCSGRDIVYSGATCGEGDAKLWMRSVGAHLYRTTGDIQDSFASVKRHAVFSLDDLGLSAPGCFADPDMLVVGMRGKGYAADGGCTAEEYLTHFGIWCMYSVPLMIGADLRAIDADCKKILLNKNLIAIDQDEECRPPYFEKRSRYSDKEKLILLKILEGNRFAIGFFNLTDNDGALHAYFSDMGLPVYSGRGFRLKDLVTGEDVGVHRDFFSVRLNRHACKIYLATVE